MLPLLPLYITYFAGGTDKKDTEKKHRIFFRALSFVAGFTLIFSLMGLFAGSIGALLRSHAVIVNLVTGSVVIIFGLSYLGVIPMNFLTPGKVGAYADTGNFAHKAMLEAAKEGEVAVAYSSRESGYDRVPKTGEIQMPPQSAYLYITTNNTIFGTEYQEYPDTGRVPLIADCSSDILARPLPMEKFSLIYGGAQKNIGPAGVTVVIARRNFLRGRDENLPSMLNYETIMNKDSMYNTPPVFNVYIVKLVTEWILSRGGLESLQIANTRKSSIVYAAMDAHPDFYTGRARKDSRSIMNATFTLPSKELEAKFLAEAAEAGMVGLKGHRLIGGIRASMYNAMPQAGCERLAAFMEDFYQKNC